MIDQQIRDRLDAISDEIRASGRREDLILAGILKGVIAATLTPSGLEELHLVMVEFSTAQVSKLEELSEELED